MPIYVFVCSTCEFRRESIVPLGTTAIGCEKCGGIANKIPTTASFVVRGYADKNGYSDNSGRLDHIKVETKRVGGFDE